VVCAPYFDPADFFKWVAEHRPTWYSAVPTMHLAFVEHGRRLSYNDGMPAHRLGLIRNCSAALLPAVADAMAELWGAVIVPTYGMTEALPICAQPAGFKDTRKHGSVGPAAGPEVAVMQVVEDGEGVPTSWSEAAPLPAHIVVDSGSGIERHLGEIVVRGACQMQGYESDCRANARTWLGGTGWMRTGDKGWISPGRVCHYVPISI
jgi:acyl-CoA synthetase (AMP-forming)/AMP-acid ligase II